ncbi:MAG: class I SAM-dependent methyltransferase [Flavobacteriales bacterium]|nr:class I SAM-dependent methyltransferase [Flavobacteriales bacterium]
MVNTTTTKHTSDFLIENKVNVPKEFNRIASRYDFATSMSQGYQQDLNTSARRMNLKGNEHVLDLCCGTGKSTLACLGVLPNGKITGVDNSEEMLAIAEKKFSKEIQSGKVEFMLKDAMKLDFPENSFDAIFMAYGLRNMPDYEACVQGLYRILKPGGTLCIHDYSLSDTWYSRPYWKILGYGFIIPISTILTGNSTIFSYLIKSVLNFLTPNQAKALLDKNGFKEISAKPLSGWRAPIQHTILAKKPN